MLKVAFFDLDDTLYPRASGIMEAVGSRIQRFVETRYNKSAEEAAGLRRRWRDTYGTALRGMLEDGYPVNVEEYFEFVHDVQLDGVLTPDPRVREMLTGLGLRLAVLTNASSEHAERILRHLRIEDLFERIIDIRMLGHQNKPHPNAFERALELMNVRAEETVLVEDTPVNTRSAKAMGMVTILVDCPPSPDADWFVGDVALVGDVIRTFIQP